MLGGWVWVWVLVWVEHGGRVSKQKGVPCVVKKVDGMACQLTAL